MLQKILIIDDDPVTLTMLAKLLGRANVQILTSRDGEEGLDLIWSERPVLVICDVLIPRIDGLDLCRTIKADEELHSTRVILMSGVYKDLQLKTDFWESGADEFITKPINTKLLKEKVNQYLSRD